MTDQELEEIIADGVDGRAVGVSQRTIMDLALDLRDARRRIAELEAALREALMAGCTFERIARRSARVARAALAGGTGNEAASGTPTAPESALRGAGSQAANPAPSAPRVSDERLTATIKDADEVGGHRGIVALALDLRDCRALASRLTAAVLVLKQAYDADAIAEWFTDMDADGVDVKAVWTDALAAAAIPEGKP